MTEDLNTNPLQLPRVPTDEDMAEAGIMENVPTEELPSLEMMDTDFGEPLQIPQLTDIPTNFSATPMDPVFPGGQSGDLGEIKQDILDGMRDLMRLG